MDGPTDLHGPDDARAAGYANLVEPARRRDADRQPEVFVVEGVRAIRQLLDDGWPLESLMLSTARCEGRPDLVRDALAAGVPVYRAGQELFDRISGYHAHRGALALARRRSPRSVRSVAEGTRLLLVVEGVNDHENLGSLFRNAAAFGAGGVILDPSTADPLYRRSVRVSIGHVLRVPFARAGAWPGALAELRSRGFRVAALTPGGDVALPDLPDLPAAGRWAVMVGAEGSGLSPGALAEADVAVRIPMAAGVDSLNVATAAAVALYQVASRL